MCAGTALDRDPAAGTSDERLAAAVCVPGATASTLNPDPLPPPPRQSKHPNLINLHTHTHRYSIAPARCYAESMDQLFLLREAGFVKAGAENLFLIANGDKWCV